MADENTKQVETIDGLNVQDFLDQFNEMDHERKPWESRWQTSTDFVRPNRSLREKSQQGQTVGRRIYSSRAEEANDTWGEGLLGNVIAPQTDWFKLKLPFLKLDDNHDVKVWLENSQNQMYWAINRSNFYATAIQFFKDGGCIGTSYMSSEEMIEDGRIKFQAWHYFKMFIAENQYGEVDTVYSQVEMNSRKAVQKFGKENVSKRVLKAYEARDFSTQFTFIHATQPRKSRDEGKVDSKNMPFLSVYIEKGEKKFIKEEGFRKNPWIVWRVEKNSDESYGRGPADKAYTDIQISNQVAKDNLVISQKLADPPTLQQGKFNEKVRLSPAARNFTDDVNAKVSTLFQGNNYDVALNTQNRQEDIIDRAFKVDFWLLLARNDVQKTATEVNAIQGEKAVLLGSTIGRLHTEFLNPVLDRVYQIESDAGRMPPPPQIVLDNLEGAEIEIEYFGPLAQLQKQTTRNRGINQSIGALIPLSEIFPSMIDKIDPDGLANAILDANGAPTEIMFSDEEVVKIRKAKAEAAAAAAQAQQAEAMAEQIPNLSKAPEEGSPLANAQEAQQGAAV